MCLSWANVLDYHSFPKVNSSYCSSDEWTLGQIYLSDRVPHAQKRTVFYKMLKLVLQAHKTSILFIPSPLFRNSFLQHACQKKTSRCKMLNARQFMCHEPFMNVPHKERCSHNVHNQDKQRFLGHSMRWLLTFCDHSNTMHANKSWQFETLWCWTEVLINMIPALLETVYCQIRKGVSREKKLVEIWCRKTSWLWAL